LPIGAWSSGRLLQEVSVRVEPIESQGSEVQAERLRLLLQQTYRLVHTYGSTLSEGLRAAGIGFGSDSQVYWLTVGHSVPGSSRDQGGVDPVRQVSGVVPVPSTR
jgi:hypothetical protein